MTNDEKKKREVIYVDAERITVIPAIRRLSGAGVGDGTSEAAIEHLLADGAAEDRQRLSDRVVELRNGILRIRDNCGDASLRGRLNNLLGYQDDAGVEAPPAEATRLRAMLQDAIAERDEALQRAKELQQRWDAMLQANERLGARLGWKEGEGFVAFVERLARERDALSMDRDEVIAAIGRFAHPGLSLGESVAAVVAQRNVLAKAAEPGKLDMVLAEARRWKRTAVALRGELARMEREELKSMSDYKLLWRQVRKHVVPGSRTWADIIVEQAKVEKSLRGSIMSLDAQNAELARQRDEAVAENAELRAKLDEAHEATGVFGVDAPMTLRDSIVALRTERDEARATKDMHKERADAADAECEDMRNQLAGAELACGQLRDALAKSEAEREEYKHSLDKSEAEVERLTKDYRMLQDNVRHFLKWRGRTEPRSEDAMAARLAGLVGMSQPAAEPAPDPKAPCRLCGKPLTSDPGAWHGIGECVDTDYVEPAPDRTFERWLEHNQRISALEISDRHQDDRIAEVDRRVAALEADVWAPKGKSISYRVGSLEESVAELEQRAQREVKP